MKKLGVPALLEAEDFQDIPPERRSNITYVSTMYNQLRKQFKPA